MPYLLLQVADLSVAAHRKRVKNAAFAGIEGDPEKVSVEQFYFRNRQVDIHVRLEGDTHAIAIGTVHCRFI